MVTEIQKADIAEYRLTFDTTDECTEWFNAAMGMQFHEPEVYEVREPFFSSIKYADKEWDLTKEFYIVCTADALGKLKERMGE